MKLANKVKSLLENKAKSDLITFINSKYKTEFTLDDLGQWEDGDPSKFFDKTIRDLVSKTYGLNSDEQDMIDGGELASSIMEIPKQSSSAIAKWKKRLKKSLDNAEDDMPW